jgi:ATP-dependent DNA helicase DinG
MASDTRFNLAAARAWRREIAEAGGIELFAIGRLDEGGKVAQVEVLCRGQKGAVPALMTRPRAGEVVIHNHPSGVVEASDADMHLAGMYGEDGVGVVITDNDCRVALWVVEPLVREPVPVDEADVRHFFDIALPKSMPDAEAREGQLAMALAVTAAMNGDQIAVLEAGTGTGKSLAYLVPAVLWAIGNESKVAVATYTIALQAQLATSDIPLLRRAGLEFRHAVVKGRSNYVCRRRLAETLQTALDDTDGDTGQRRLLADLVQWAEAADEGTRQDLAVPVDEELWERIESDHDQTLRARCPHFDTCFYYRARRAAADAHLLVVNHHLLLADLVVKSDSGGEGVLPRYRRVVLDEGHHLEDAATGLFQSRLTDRAIQRAVTPLLDRRKRRGALSRLHKRFTAKDSPLWPAAREELSRHIDILKRVLPRVKDGAPLWLGQVGADALAPPHTPTLRLTPKVVSTELWQQHLRPTITREAQTLSKAAGMLAKIEDMLASLEPKHRLAEPQPLFDLARARRRLSEKADQCLQFSGETEELVMWIEPGRSRKGRDPVAALCAAPVDVGPLLRERVFDALDTTVVTSATLTVHGSFSHLLSRIGLAPPADGPEGAFGDAAKALPPAEVHTGSFPSPFDYRTQALLALPRDFPEPDHPRWRDWVARAVTTCTEAAGGGVFVLCTSYTLLDELHARAETAFGDQLVLLKQGSLPRARLLEQFRQSGNAVLFGTDSFWEGVSVPGDALRMVLIPRLPFRVPTEPVQQARHERLEARGHDPFRAYSLPQAVLRLRQGFGRLVRTRKDRGVVIVLDRRVASRWYGRVFLSSLPEMERATGPMRAVLERLKAFYAK